jgi:hypothetical protein
MPAILEHIVAKFPHFRIVSDHKNRAPVFRHVALLPNWFIWSVSYVWLNQTDQINQID